MPHYFFHYQNGEMLRDEVGQDLADDAAARAEARVAASELIAEQIAEGKAMNPRDRIFVERDGELAFVLQFEDLVKGSGHNI